MAFISGTASDFSDLLAKFRAGCTANGYTLSTNVLHKDDVYFYCTVSGSSLYGISGVGIGGGDALVSPAPRGAYLMQVAQTVSMTFPVSYNLHILTDPDEVFLVVKYSTDSYVNLMFGKSPAEGTHADAGIWFHGSSCNSGASKLTSCVANPVYNGGFGNGYNYCLPFWSMQNDFVNISGYGYSGIGVSSQVTTMLESKIWAQSGVSQVYGNQVSLPSVQPAFQYQPNSWSGEAILFPVNVWAVNGSHHSLVAKIKHLKFLRIDNYDPEDVITIGSDEWKVYPACRKNVTNRNGSENADGYTGTIGFAVRYDGP